MASDRAIRLQARGRYWRAVWTERGAVRSRNLGRRDRMSEREALRAADAIEERLRSSGSIERGAGVTVEAWGRTYLELRPDLDARTVAIYATALERFAAHVGPATPLRAVEPIDAERWRASMIAEGLAENTIRKHTRCVKAMCRKAVEVGVLPSNPAASLPGAVVRVDVPDRTVTPAEIEAVLEACPGPHWRAAFAVAYYAGLRLREIKALGWAAVKWGRGRLIVEHDGVRGTKRRRRTVRMEPELEALLLDVYDASESGAVCDLPQSPQRQAMRIIERSGVRPWPQPFQTLRRSRERIWKAAYPAYVVNAWMGHSAGVALRHYEAAPEEYYRT
ncbi:MAG: hypothetical protein D6692_04055, partial [Planctomycetota bacterium]